MKIAIFIIGLIYCLISLFTNNPTRKLIGFLGFVFVIQVGWIFYHYTGIFIYDFPILFLVLYGFFSGRKFKWYFKGLSLPAILIIFWVLLTTTVAQNKGWTLGESSKILRGYLAFLAVANNVRTKKDVDIFLSSIFAGVLFESLMGLWQWRIGATGLWFLNENYNQWRATGTFYVPHFLGNYLIMILPVLIRLFIFYRAENKRLTIFYGMGSALGILTLFVTFARGAWLGFIVSTGIMALFSLTFSRYRPRVKWAMAVSVFFAMIFVGHYLATIQSQFGEERKSAVDIRWVQYGVALRVIQGLPVMGTGLGNYELGAPNFLTDYERSLPDAGQRTYMVHNSYLYFTAETGLVGGFLLLWGIFLLFRTGFRIVRSRSLYFSNISIGLLTGHVAIAVAFLFGPDIHLEQFQVQFGMSVGLLVALRKIEVNYLKQQRKPSERAV
ncbi:hypothetical protein EH221_02550 [bacterium]|nr:MAG: hypothetical protein EH221_02550 [bacterium]